MKQAWRGGSAIEGDLVSCWMCRRAVSPRAMFCHGCGSVQPARPLDHFTRLGLEKRFDLDLAVLNRQYVGFRRALAPERFASRGTRERSHAQAQNEAFAAAYEELKDPVRRARYLLLLHGVGDRPLPDTEAVELGELREALGQASDVAAIDLIANQAGRDREESIHRLSSAFRSGDLDRAAIAVARLDVLDALSVEARDRRLLMLEEDA